nr:hypothetical protein [Candidatus Sigynarchaeota archaeon]
MRRISILVIMALVYGMICFQGPLLARSGNGSFTKAKGFSPRFDGQASALSKLPSLWDCTWGGDNTDAGYGVWGDGTAIYTCGKTYSFGAGIEDMMLVKWDDAGNQVWNRTWGGNDSDSALSIWGYGSAIYTCGYTASYGAGGNDMVLVKWDSAGNQVWNRTWGGIGSDAGSSIWGDDTSLYTCGSTHCWGAGSHDILLVKWDDAGNQVWNRTWGGTSEDYGYSVWGNGTAIYTCGYTHSFGAGWTDMVIIKWDDAGNQVWNRTWGGISIEFGNSVWCESTAIHTCGTTNSFERPNEVQNTDIMLVKWDAAGNQVWNRTWGGNGNDEAYSVWGDGTSLYTCGSTFISEMGMYDIVVIKWDAMTGAIQWDRTWDRTTEDCGYSIWGDGTAIYTCGAVRYDMVLLKWDAATGLTPQLLVAIIVTIIICIVVACIIVPVIIVKRRRLLRVDKKEAARGAVEQRFEAELTPVPAPEPEPELAPAPTPRAVSAPAERARMDTQRREAKKRLAQQHREEQTRIAKLREIMEVSESIEIAQIATILEMDEAETLKRIVGWAKQFGFKIKGREVIFTQGDINAAIEDLDKEFGKWASKEKVKDGKL